MALCKPCSVTTTCLFRLCQIHSTVWIVYISYRPYASVDEGGEHTSLPLILWRMFCNIAFVRLCEIYQYENLLGSLLACIFDSASFLPPRHARPASIVYLPLKWFSQIAKASRSVRSPRALTSSFTGGRLSISSTCLPNANFIILVYKP